MHIGKSSEIVLLTLCATLTVSYVQMPGIYNRLFDTILKKEKKERRLFLWWQWLFFFPIEYRQ